MAKPFPKKYYSLIYCIFLGLRDECQQCNSIVDFIFKAAKGEEFQKLIKPMIQKELTCEGDDPDELCDLSNEEIDKIYTYVGEKMVFTTKAAESTCSITKSCK